MQGDLETKVANRLAKGGKGTIRIGDKLYLANPPTQADFQTLRKRLAVAWKEANKNPLSAVAAELKEMDPELRAIVQDGAISRAVDRKTGNAAAEAGDLAELLTQPKESAFWAWYLCRENHPELTLPEVEAAIADAGAADRLLADLMLATGMKEADPNSAGGNGSSS